MGEAAAVPNQSPETLPGQPLDARGMVDQALAAEFPDIDVFSAHVPALDRYLHVDGAFDFVVKRAASEVARRPLPARVRPRAVTGGARWPSKS